MDPLGIVIGLMALANLIFAGLIYFHGQRDRTEVLYAAISVCASVWASAVLLLSASFTGPMAMEIAARVQYMVGNLAYLSFLWFAVAYPPFRAGSSLFPKVVSILNGILLTLVGFSPFLIRMVDTAASSLEERLIIAPGGLFIFIAFLFFILVSAEVILARKLIQTKGLERTRLGVLMIGTFVAGFLGIFLNLFLPLIGNFTFFTVGPIFVTAAFVGISGYIVYRYQLFQLKIIATEVFVIMLVFGLLFRFTREEGSFAFFVDGVIAFFAAVVGYLLIKSVVREVRNREQIAQLAKELAENNEELKKLDRAKSEFISIASHQLRAPLTVIKGYISLIIEGTLGAVAEAMREPLRRAFFSTEQLVKLVTSLLDLSRIEAGKIRYEFAAHDFTNLVMGIVEEFRPVARERGVALTFNPPQELPAVFLFDSDKIREVVINLVDNAVKYSPQGEPVEITVAPSSESSVRLSVTDSGIGIRQEDIGQLFTKFTRTDASRKIDPNGMGIGLYFVKRVVEDHRGKVWVESEGVGKGSTFFVELPLNR